MMTRRPDAAFEQRLREMLDAKAEQIAPATVTTRFELDRPVVAREVRHTGDSRGVRRALTIAAAVVLVIVVAVGALVAVRSSSKSGNDTAPTTAIAPIAGALGLPTDIPILAPATPDGMQLWSMQTVVGMPQSPYPLTQLFGHVDADGAPDPGLLVEMTSVSPHSEVMPGATNRVLVRGVNAAVVPSKDAGAAPQEIDWIENDSVLVRITIRGISPEDAAAVIDQLHPRSDQLLDGFDPASAPAGISLLGEHEQTGDTPAPSDAYLEYGTHAPTLGAPAELLVHTSTVNAYPGYLRTWIAGSGTAKGSASFDPDIGLIVSRPDAQITVGPPSLGEAELRRVADSVAAADAGQVQAMRADVNQRLQSLPLIDAADAGPVHLELRGDSAPSTLCARTDEGPTVCSAPLGMFAPSSHDAPTYLAGSATLDSGGWLVFGAATAQPRFGVDVDEKEQLVRLPIAFDTSLGGLFASVAVVGTDSPWVSATTDGSSIITIPRPNG